MGSEVLFGCKRPHLKQNSFLRTTEGRTLLGCKQPHLKQNSFSLQREAIFFLHHNLILLRKINEESRKKVVLFSANKLNAIRVQKH